MPQTANVRAPSGDGHIRVSRVNGTIVLRSGDGRIQAATVPAAVSVATGDGSHRARSAWTERCEATTGDGRVRASGKLTGVRARSGDGSIAIRGAARQRTEADWDITSGDGSITLHIPDDFNAELDARTRGDGSVHLNGVSVTGTAADHARTAPAVSWVRVAVRCACGTGDGSITLRRLVSE